MSELTFVRKLETTMMNTMRHKHTGNTCFGVVGTVVITDVRTDDTKRGWFMNTSVGSEGDGGTRD